ncbi:thrombospondin type-1 domain-containing protein 1 [Chanos chanos]|uniref:Thrombospondin type-1 domain-containing protein 1 n=1 Tax=Chanos chanos TaxID=29144 RepID=A0A6J2WW71_CHACN|nr:thrombospondin type-1 domain-containing protein 1 [Chanos chanos]
MTQECASVLPFLLALMGFVTAGINLWPSVHTALSNASVFVEYHTDSNTTGREMTVHLVDMNKNVTVLTRHISSNQSEGSLEFNCSCFLYAGHFRFRLMQTMDSGDTTNRSTIWWWSPELYVQWPTFHISVDRTSNHSSSAFQIGVFTNNDFHACSDSRATSLYLEVSYLEHNQIGTQTIDKVRDRRRHDIKLVKSQHVEIDCALHLTEQDFIQVSLKSPHTEQDIKSPGPVYLSRIFSYKLLVDNIYKSGCDSTVVVRLVSPPCAVTSGKVVLYREETRTATATAVGTEVGKQSHLAYNWFTHGQNETEFNCSVFDLGKNKYCFHFVLIYSQAHSRAQTCVIVQRNSETWGPWQSWSGCSVTCGEGVRERVRECLVPSGGGMRCTGMVREQSHCSLEDCTDVPQLSPSVTPPPAVVSPLGGNLMAVAGISLCLAVILATVLITVWRKLCHTPKCSSVRRSSMHSPSGRKNSDEASICGHSLQRPSFSESLQAAPPQKGFSLSPTTGSSERPLLTHQQSLSLPLPLPQDPERMSPSGQKIVPPIFGYRLAQQQLKEMKKKGLKEATQVYHVSQSPVDDTMLEATASTPVEVTPVPQDTDSQEDANVNRFRIKSPFVETTWTQKTSATLPDRLSSRRDPILGNSGSSQRYDRTADWVEMVELSTLGYSKNPNFRRTSSFHESKQQQQLPPRPFRERSMTQVAPRQLPEGSCRTKAWEHPIPELEYWSQSKPRMPDNSVDHRRRPWIEPMISQSESKSSVTAPIKPGIGSTSTSEPSSNRHVGGQGLSLALDRAERAEQNWSRRGPSPIQRNILARKLREANSSASGHRQRSSTFSSSEQRRGRCRSLPLSADYSNSTYGLSESEQRMMDISGYLGEED